MKAGARHLGLMVIGEGLVALVSDESLPYAEDFKRTQLGGGLTAAVAAARMGVDCSLVTRVGEDVFTDWLLDSWDAEHLHLDHVRRVAGSNGLVVVSAMGEDRERIVYQSSAAASGLDQTDIDHLPWEMTLFGYATGELQSRSPESRSALLAAFREARTKGTRTVFNPLLRPGMWPGDESRLARAAFEEILEHTDLLIVKAPYATGQLLGEPAAEQAAEAAHRRGVPEVVVRGADGGCVVSERNGSEQISGPLDGLHPAMDTVFDGVLIAALARGLDLRAAVRASMQILETATPFQLGLAGIPAKWPEELS